MTSIVGATSCSDDSETTPNVVFDPEVTVNPKSVNFGLIELNTESAVQSVEVSGLDLKGDMTATVSDNFTVSLDDEQGFQTGSITISAADFDDESVEVYVKCTGANEQGSVEGTLTFSTQDATDVEVSLIATVGATITGDLFLSEYFDQYGSEWQDVLPLDTELITWGAARDAGNETVMNTWYAAQANATTLPSSLAFSSSTTLSITGYPSAPTNARSVWLQPQHEGKEWPYIINGDICKDQEWLDGQKVANTAVLRRFTTDDYKDDVFMSSLIKVTALGELSPTKNDHKGIGDIIIMASTASGPSNNDNIKVIALSDGNGGFNFGLQKAGEGNAINKTTDSYSLNETYAVVVSHEFVEGAENDITKLYVFEEGDQIPTDMSGLTPVATIEAGYAGPDPRTLNTVYFRERRKEVVTPTAEITGIRVGNTWVATLFADAANALVSNDLTGRTVSNQPTTDCD